MNIGVDLISIKRVENLLRYKKHISKIYNKVELEQLNNHSTNKKLASMSGKLAAKEATLKALSLGLGDINLVDIEITNEKSGKPILSLHNEGLKKANELGLTNFNVSISHDKDYAIAMVILK